MKQQLRNIWRGQVWRLKDIVSIICRYILRNILSIFPSEPVEKGYPLKEDSRVRDNLIHFNMWFIRMRWLACVVAIVLSIITVEALEYLEEDAFLPLMIEIACLIASNILYTLFLRRRWFIRILIELQMFTDLLILTAMLHCSGGIENPLIFVYLFHIIIGGILLEKRKCYAIVGLAFVLFSALAFVEMVGFRRHYTLHIFPHIEKEGSLLHAAHEPIYVISLVVLQIVLMSLTAYFTTTIMEQLRSEEDRALAERQRLERVIEATGVGFALFDNELSPVWLNDQIKIWLNLSDEVIGHLTPQLEEWIEGKNGPVAETFKDGKTRVVERQLVDQGSKRFFQVTIASLMDNTGNVYQVVELTQEVTQRKMVEAEMVHSAKMAVLGSMAAGIAHEIGNPLASISTRLRLLEKKHDETFLKESLRLLQSQIARINRIVHGISQFAKSVKEEWSACQINQIVVETLNVLRFHPKAKKNQIYTELAEELPETMGVKDQLVQVFLNLGLNALEAMPHGGVLTVKTYTGEGEIRIEFADTGAGMDRELRSKIFDPFFTTKDSGLGLGLCIVHNIIDAHGGRIEVESSPAEGSLFTVNLPIRTPGELSHNIMEVSEQ